MMFKGSTNNLPQGEEPAYVLWPEKLKIIFKILMKKKLENDSNVEECSDYQKMQILKELSIFQLND